MEKQILEFTKVQDAPTRRCYKLSHAITNAPNKHFDWQEEKRVMQERIKQEYKHLIPDAIQYVVVSDAHTHVERLAFPAFEYESGLYSVLSFMKMDGANTMQIYGGDPRSVHPDEVYLRRIASANGMVAKFNFNRLRPQSKRNEPRISRNNLRGI